MQQAITPNSPVPAVPSDYPSLIRLWEASVRATHFFLEEDDILFYKPLILNKYFKSVQLFCKKDEQGTITVFLGISKDHIEMLFIDPDFLGRGIGQELLSYAVNSLGIRKVDVNEQNGQAAGFYKRFGFEVTGRTAVDSMGKPYPILHMELIQSPTNHA